MSDEESSPVGVGDGRRKHVTVVTHDGEEIEHADVYLRHTDDGFVVSPEWDFEGEQARRYEKDDIRRLDVIQHHSSCFLTTAVAGEGETLDALRQFRDEVLAENRVGRTLVGFYYRTSPPVAATLAAHPDSPTARAVRRLVFRCANLECRRTTANSPAVRRGLAVTLTVLYAIGMLVALFGHAFIEASENWRGAGALGRDVHSKTRETLSRSE
ncbi:MULTISPECIES: CFI-box-CTERM domain-containing protein [unclassified Haladaptatus]|uniref:CFI-box-CTERM domain-containing protein n=1 Tax=unclassified Haladaptatus TaxID=2622732 RepID=UPI0023E89FEC|nr:MULTISPECIES: CFI-box-CTERM domain-containing protein [unclassified Haladaptatus]